MTLDISAETPRVQYTVTSADSTFDYDFEIFQDSDIKVFVDSTLKTLTTHYTVSGAGTTGGSGCVVVLEEGRESHEKLPERGLERRLLREVAREEVRRHEGELGGQRPAEVLEQHRPPPHQCHGRR